MRIKRPERVAAVDKIEEKRGPEDFIGHRNREKINNACGVVCLNGTRAFLVRISPGFLLFFVKKGPSFEEGPFYR